MEEVLSKAKCKIEAGEPSIIIHYEGEVVKLYEKEILYLESLSHYVTIYTNGKEYKIKALLTKDSGEEGGIKEKVDSALLNNVKVIVVKRPNLNYGKEFNDIKAMLEFIISNYNL